MRQRASFRCGYGDIGDHGTSFHPESRLRIMKTEDILGLAVPALYVLMIVAEQRWPARTYPTVPKWQLLGLGFVVVMMTTGVVAPLLLPVDWLARHRLVDGTKLGVAGGAIVGWLAVTFFSYWYHRVVHASSLLWRFTHQIHHAPRRLDIPSGVMFHPVDLVMFNTIAIVVLVLGLGVEPLAAAIVGLFGSFTSLAEHWNVKTPRWLGYIVVRSEAHAFHHERNVHARNYGDCPLWDIVFGTFENPQRFEGEAGFDVPAPMLSMLVGVDVHASGTPTAAPAPAE